MVIHVLRHENLVCGILDAETKTVGVGPDQYTAFK